MNCTATILLIFSIVVIPSLLSAQQAYKVTYQREFTLAGIKKLPIPTGPGGFESLDRSLEESELYYLRQSIGVRYSKPIVDMRVEDGVMVRDTTWKSFVIKDLTTRLSVVKQLSGYCIHDELLKQENWSIKNDLKSINGFLAQRAVQISGRSPDTEVWFYPSSPVQDGPGSITGLPGLVVDALTDDVHYYIVSIEKISHSEFELAFNNTNDCDEVITREEYINSVMGN